MARVGGPKTICYTELGEFRDHLARLGERKSDIEAEALLKQLVTPKRSSANVPMLVWRATPASNIERYRAKMVGQGMSETAGGWKAKGWSKWAKGNPAVARKVNDYGKQRLRRSLFHDRGSGSFNASAMISRADIERIPSGITFTMSSSLDYATRVHESKIPDGQNWVSPGKAPNNWGWSTKGTHAGFLTRTWEENRQSFAEGFFAHLSDCIANEMEASL